MSVELLKEKQAAAPAAFKIDDGRIFYIYFPESAVYNMVICRLSGDASGNGHLLMSVRELKNQFELLQPDPGEEVATEEAEALRHLKEILEAMKVVKHDGDIWFYTA